MTVASGPTRARGPVPGRRADRRVREAGYNTIEAVITFPVLILLVMLVVQFALWWHGRNVAEAAALALPEIVRALDGQTPKRVIVVPNRIVNVVL